MCPARQYRGSNRVISLDPGLRRDDASVSDRARAKARRSRTDASLHYAYRLHGRAQVGVRLGHELDEVVRGRVDHPEAALGHELVVFLAGDDLLDRGNELVARFGGDA